MPVIVNRHSGYGGVVVVQPNVIERAQPAVNSRLFGNRFDVRERIDFDGIENYDVDAVFRPAIADHLLVIHDPLNIAQSVCR